MAVLQQINNIPTMQQLLDLVTQLQADNEALKAKAKIRYKVSEKGALSVYGLNVRFPVTLYASQWERLLADVPQMQAFIKVNSTQLVRKA